MKMYQLHYYQTDLVWQKAEEKLISVLENGWKEDRRILLLLSGGSVVKLYAGLAHYINYNDISQVTLAIAQVDERFQPEDLSDINANAIVATGLWEACRKRKVSFYLIPQEGNLQQAAQKYQHTISELFKIYTYKVAVLGIGEDGHTAGLLPGYKGIWQKERYVVGYEIDQRQNNTVVSICKRITITSKALQQLDHGIVVAVGEEKREALAKINDMRISDMDKFPAVILRKIKKVDFFTDRTN